MILSGTYESGVANYKHVYFNTDGNTLRMWIITVVWVLYLYEAFKRLFLLLLSKKLRWTMGILLLSSIHSHQYSWWALWNYLNDEFYSMWYHQIFFSVTELISSVLVLNYLDVRRSIKPIPMLIVWTIAVFHISCAGWDQFVFTVIQGKGRLHQVFFMEYILIFLELIPTPSPFIFNFEIVNWFFLLIIGFKGSFVYGK